MLICLQGQQVFDMHRLGMRTRVVESLVQKCTALECTELRRIVFEDVFSLAYLFGTLVLAAGTLYSSRPEIFNLGV